MSTTAELTGRPSVNLLLVDDQVRNLEVLEAILESPDYRLVRAPSGNAALLALMNEEFAAIVLDIQMPDMSGLELARLIKQRKRNQYIPILFLTAHFLEDTDVLEGYGVGAVDYLTKPINPQILRSKVAAFVELFRTTRALEQANLALEQEIGQRKAAQAALTRVNDELELRVRQRTEELSRSEEQFRRAIEDAPIPVIMHAEDGQVLQISKTWAKLTGYTMAEVPTMDAWLTRAYGYGANEIRSAVRSLFERDTGMGEVEFEILTRSGQQRVWAFSASSPGVLGDGRRFVVGTALDITERKAAADLLRHSEARYRHLIHALPTAIYTCDADGVITLYNQAAIDLWGRAPEIGQESWCGAVRSYLPNGSYLAPDAGPMALTLRSGCTHHRQEMVIERPDGSQRFVIFDAHPLRDQEGELMGAVSIVLDVTESKRTEAALREAKEEAEAASKAKDDFLAALSHELRTPLNPALLLASEREGDPMLEAAVREDFGAIRQDIELEARLIDDLLDLTRISSGKLHLEPRRIDLHALIHWSWDRLRAEADEKQIQVHFDCGTATPWLKADPVRLQQVFSNLMKNALRFTPAGGRIEIRSYAVAPEAWRVEIADTGVGIASEDLERIFSPFTQGEHGPRFGGLGLGLAICRRLVELHRGRIFAESEGPGRGARFIIELPSSVGPDGGDEKSTSPFRVAMRPAAGPQVSFRILLVEDHGQTRRTLARLLTQRGHTVTTAESVREALEQAQSFSFDLLLSDLGLPDGNGHDLIGELRQLRPDCWGIALSGYGMESDAQRSLDAGFHAHLTKPIDIQALEQTLSVIRSMPPAPRRAEPNTP
ncbi:MAG: response regulator [Verrucomicrobiales bacterium]|nr:response regulator [Verrucomicrobiales bacterium]